MDQASATAFAEGLASLAKGRAQVDAIMPDATALPMAFAAPSTEGGQLKVRALRASSGAVREANIRAVAANGRSLADAKARIRCQHPRKPKHHSICPLNSAMRCSALKLPASAMRRRHSSLTTVGGAKP